jgi:hypothetical protein
MFAVLPEMEAESDRRTASDGAAFLGIPHGRDSPPMIEITLDTNMMAQFAGTGRRLRSLHLERPDPRILI